MDFIWILCAFSCGSAARLINLPPLIGYLMAGFLLNFMGMESGDSLKVIANLGITLMLFTIGLKLNLKDLIKLEVWSSTLSHMTLWIVFASFLLWLATMLGLHHFVGLELKVIAVISFALSFSSTVCIVKILEESGELKTRHGKLSVGILVMQDVVAVVFMVFATGVLPSIWSIALVGLIFLRPLFTKILEHMGHGELLPLMGFFLALGGYELFYLVGIKGDLGALIMGVLLSGHSKTTELYKSLMSFKDLFLIGFFLSIGFTALPTLEMVIIALGITLLLPIKAALFFALFSALKLRVRTSFLAALVLSNFSEFGLIVADLCVNMNWLSKEWLVILALSVSLSFVFTSVLYRSAHTFYIRLKSTLCRFETPNRLKQDTFRLPKNIEVLVVGMGRVGKGSYNALVEQVGNTVLGMDADEERVERLKKQGYRIVFGDGEDADLWEYLDLSHIKLVLIALPYIRDIQNIQEQLKNANYQGKVVAIARYEDQIELLKETGIDRIFNFYHEAGVGFAKESLALIK
jgi:predicted Kef-type K+ transport protein